MSSGPTPNWDLYLASIWGPGSDDSGFASYPWLASLASNVVIGSNPPYTLNMFLGFYPKYYGSCLASGLQATLTQDSNQITITSTNPPTFIVGGLITGPGIPDNTFIQSISGPALTLSNSATSSGTGIALTAYQAPPIPFVVILAFIAAANAGLQQALWQDLWILAMGLYVSHFLTLYARSDGNPNSNTGQIAAQGIAYGIQVSKSAGDISVSYQPIQGTENWAAWNLTSYGQQLITFARALGSGPMLLY